MNKNMSDSHQFIKQDLALLVTPITGEPKIFTVARQKPLRAMCVTRLLVSTQLAGLVEINTHPNVAERYDGMKGKGVHGRLPGAPL